MLGCVGLCWTLLGPAGLCWAVLCSVGLRWSLLGSAGLCWVLLGCVGLCWAVLGCVGSINVFFHHDSSQQTLIIFPRKIYWFMFIIQTIGVLSDVPTGLLAVML